MKPTSRRMFPCAGWEFRDVRGVDLIVGQDGESSELLLLLWGERVSGCASSFHSRFHYSYCCLPCVLFAEAFRELTISASALQSFSICPLDL